MGRKLTAALLLPLTLGLGGCGLNAPTYEAVRDEVTSSLDRIVAVVPNPKEVVPQPGSDPYPCDNPLLLSRHQGAFFTGHWFVYVPEDFDIDLFIESLPGLLGDDWERVDPQVSVSFSNVDVLYKPLGLTVSVEDALSDGRPALELLAISRCGTLTGEETTPVPSAPPTSDPLT
ncbi:hypothetical protein QE410_001864 [Microbacterium sp. SORGH_AS 1204]|uniref:hypothetical protein n=1 Tax=Microbacterium sp. SORGH_AS_1204 TaxID=3041785 RepID=UPI0027915D96|nr:hypothetical protein [Microbacterium sp. SORGH_AS_1204]MDQ1137065.1 hypothetical protein [Microbacterium sp. SORGH_AS_1204]